MRIALFQPDMPQNVGAAIRVAACFGAGLDLIAPFGFAAGARDIRRVGLDYQLHEPPLIHPGWDAFRAAPRAGPLILLTTGGDTTVWDFRFAGGETILLGRESAGAPREVHEAAAARLKIPLAPGARSLNVAVAAAVALAEARRQTGWTG